jgi:hypothetical protein
MLVIVVGQPEKADGTQDIDLAGAATYLRKIYLADSLHNTLLLSIFVAITLNIFHIPISWPRVTFLLLAASFLFSQLPFAIGQAALRRAVLYPYTPTKETEVAEKLYKVAPLAPAYNVVNSFITTGAGSFLFYLLDETIKNQLKLLGS